jgi:hypothetical protein
MSHDLCAGLPAQGCAFWPGQLPKHCGVDRVWIANQNAHFHVAQQSSIHTNQILIGHHQMHLR